MGNLRSRLRRILKDRRGQSTTEYILILAVVVMVALRFKTAFQKTLTGAVDKLNTDIESSLSDASSQ